MNRGRRVVLVVALLLTAFVLSPAFASGSQDGATDGEPEGKLWFVYRAPAWADLWVNPVLPEFEALYPQVEVELQNIPHSEYTFKLQLGFASKNVPDVIELNLNQNFDFFAAQGLLESLQPYIEQEGFPLEAFSDTVVDRLSKNGELHMMPVGSHPGIAAVAYNKTQFDAAGLDHPSDDWTYDEYLDLARELTLTDDAGRTVQFGTVAPAVWVPIVSVLASYGGGWIDESGTQSLLQDPDTVEAYRLIDRIVNAERLAPRADEMIGDARASFMGGQSSMYFMGVWEIGGIKSGMAEGNEAGVVPLPIGPAGRIPAGANIDAFAMTADAQNKAAAWAMLEWFGGEDMQRRVVTEGIGLTPRTHLLDELDVASDPWMAPFVEALLSGEFEPSPIPANFRVGEMRNTISQNLDPALAGTMSMDDALRAAHQALQEVLEQPAPEEM